MNELFEKILIARELKFEKIQFLKTTFKTVITVKSNFPGSNKNHNLSYFLVDYFIKKVPSEFIASKEFFEGHDGPYYLIGSDVDATLVKTRLMDIEDNHPIGRFVDFDVFDGVVTLTRHNLRKCYLCNEPAFKCIVSKKHLELDLIEYMNTRIVQFLKDEIVRIIDESILAELNLDPKFGLVTPFTNGSHKDMDYSLMIKAKDEILPFFEEMIQEGWSSKNLDYIFKRIRLIGKAAEDKMNSVTANVNAYKGLIFGMGILATAYSYILFNHLHVSKIYDIVTELSSNILEDFNQTFDTFGYYAFKQYNILGARGEFHKGIPNVKKALQYLVDFSDDAKLKTLMFLISKVDDTNFLKRAKNYSLYSETKVLFEKNMNANEDEIAEINDYCIEHNLTFGGSADLLILTIFLKKIML